MKDWNKGEEPSCLLNLLPDTWVKRVTKEEREESQEKPHRQDDAKKQEHHKKVVISTKANVARDFKR